MALKAIIYKARVSLSDLDHNIYSDHELTIARHPSETEERMMIRLLAYVLNAPENNDHGTLEFGKDMWEADEPALSQHDLTGLLVHWIDLGQPDEKRLVRTCGRSRKVSVYSFANTAATWWAGLAGKFTRVQNLHVWQIPAAESQEMGTLADRSMNLTITVQEGVLFVEESGRTVELHLARLCGAE